MASDTRPGPAAGDDTIVAIITPPGEGGIAAVRIAGPDSQRLLAKLFRSSSEARLQPFLMRHGRFVAADGKVADEVMAVFMPRGKSYTGEDQVEIFCHGGRQVVRLILEEIIAAGARAAEPGEFTRLAFLNGRIDLTKAEAVAEIIAADTAYAYQTSREHLLGPYATLVEKLRDQLVTVMAEIETSIDFAEEEVAPASPSKLVEELDAIGRKLQELLDSYSGGRIISEGYRIAIGGRPNAGKSSLFNLLLKQERALVHPTAGTTRDYLSEWIDLDGLAVNLIDTAGLRRGGSSLEKKGQARGGQIISRADLVLWMFDISQKGWHKKLENDLGDLGYRAILLIGNKIDLTDKSEQLLAHSDIPSVAVSCKTGRGLKQLRRAILKQTNEKMPDLTSGIVVTSARHKQKLATALKGLKRAKRTILAGGSPEIAAFELRQSVAALDEITGKLYTEEILGKIFSTFCVGK